MYICGMKGIILAGGTGSRLWPITLVTSKQLLPVYDKPMIYYPLSTLMLAGLRDIALITTIEQEHLFKKLLGDGSQWGIKLTFIPQENPDGLPNAYILSENFLQGDSSLLILGDNIFSGTGLGTSLNQNLGLQNGAKIFGYQVKNPEAYGVIEFNSTGAIVTLEEKPKSPKSNWVVPGLYFADGTSSVRAKKLRQSDRGETEILDFLKSYLDDGQLTVERISRGSVWLDTGSFEDLSTASEYVRVMEQRQGHKISCPEEIAWRNGWITELDIQTIAKKLGKSPYANYLLQLIANG
jgi:glucose-1-phosphate thymidylyltransferase